jgi:membrane protease YdiL (CAAX protease family)
VAIDPEHINRVNGTDLEPQQLEPLRDRGRPPSSAMRRVVAVLEILICSDFPTQLALSGTFAAFGYPPYTSGRNLSVAYVVGVSLVDAILLVSLIVVFLRVHGERARDVIFGERRVMGEMAAGIPMIVGAFVIAIVVLLTIQRLAPSLHTVETNPLQALLRSPRDALLFAVVVVVAGGVREEIQRAFLLHRFDQFLGGGRVGVVVTSIAFGAGHLVQGLDAAIATGLLGAYWGVVYLRRRSAVAPMVSHAGFDLLQIVQFMLVGR